MRRGPCDWVEDDTDECEGDESTAVDAGFVSRGEDEGEEDANVPSVAAAAAIALANDGI